VKKQDAGGETTAGESIRNNGRRSREGGYLLAQSIQLCTPQKCLGLIF